MPDLEHPTNEVNPRSLDELYGADPLSLTKVDRAAMVKSLRENHAAYKAEEAQAKTEGRRKKRNYVDAPKKGELKLDDLNLSGIKMK